jgi:hypothetical protein
MFPNRLASERYSSTPNTNERAIFTAGWRALNHYPVIRWRFLYSSRTLGKPFARSAPDPTSSLADIRAADKNLRIVPDPVPFWYGALFYPGFPARILVKPVKIGAVPNTVGIGNTPEWRSSALIDAATVDCHALDPPDFPPGLPYLQPLDEPIRFRTEVMEPGESFDQSGFELPPPPQVAPTDAGQGELFGDDGHRVPHLLHSRS